MSIFGREQERAGSGKASGIIEDYGSRDKVLIDEHVFERIVDFGVT